MDDFVKILFVSQYVKYLENGLDNIIRFLANWMSNFLALISAKYDENILVHFGFIQVQSFLRRQVDVRKFHSQQFAEIRLRSYLSGDGVH